MIGQLKATPTPVNVLLRGEVEDWLARALWAQKPRYSARAQQFVQKARADYLAAKSSGRRELIELNGWLTTHGH